jgi:L-rhamnose mutarotase
MKRYGKVIALRPEKLTEYLELHKAVWPEVDAMKTVCNMQNFTIFIKQLPDQRHYLFMYFEYVGSDYAADMQTMAADPITQQWWALTEPCQERLPGTPDGELWADMEEVCHFDG